MPYDPYALAFPAAAFALTSPDFVDGGDLPATSYNAPVGDNASPALAWSGHADTTRSFVVTAFDADAPIPGGLWHWAVKDLPATTTALARDAGRLGGDGLPPAATPLANDLGIAAYSGAKPPAGTGAHRMVICVTALSIPTLELPKTASLAALQIALIPHTVGRALITALSHANDA